MREIKFRYWDMVNKRFITDGDVYFVASDCVLAGDLGNPPIVDITRNVLISQYTGLKDKNGKDVYEGDICELGTGYGMYGAIGIVGFEDGEFFFTNLHEGLYGEFKVIGNIYENPELLAGEN